MNITALRQLQETCPVHQSTKVLGVSWLPSIRIRETSAGATGALFGGVTSGAPFGGVTSGGGDPFGGGK